MTSWPLIPSFSQRMSSPREQAFIAKPSFLVKYLKSLDCIYSGS